MARYLRWTKRLRRRGGQTFEGTPAGQELFFDYPPGMFARVVQEAKGGNELMLDWRFFFQWGAAAEQSGQLGC